MKYSIFINQKLLQEVAPEINLKDAAILDYVKNLCRSRSKKLCKVQSNDGKIYTWMDYKHLLREMPLLGFKSTAAISYAIKRLEKSGFITTAQDEKTYRKYVTLTDKIDLIQWDAGIDRPEAVYDKEDE